MESPQGPPKVEEVQELERRYRSATTLMELVCTKEQAERLVSTWAGSAAAARRARSPLPACRSKYDVQPVSCCRFSCRPRQIKRLLEQAKDFQECDKEKQKLWEKKWFCAVSGTLAAAVRARRVACLSPGETRCRFPRCRRLASSARSAPRSTS